MAFVLSSVRSIALRNVSTTSAFLPALNRFPIHANSRPSLKRRPVQPVRLMASEEGVDPPVDLSAPTIFDKIIAKEIPADIVYEDDQSLAFRDINPQAPTHVLVIPKRRIAMLSAAQESDKEILGHLMLTAAKVAELEGLGEGYRVLINNGKNGLQSVYHIHLHVIGGRKLKWGPF